MEQVGLLNPYRVPVGYFESLPLQIITRVRKDIDPELSFQNNPGTPYSVPDGYFENFSAILIQRIESEADTDRELAALSGILGKIDKKMPYSTPEGYFEDLADSVTDGAKAIELTNKTLDSVLTQVRKSNVYEVPPGYFEALPATLLAMVKPKQETKVVSGNFRRRVMQYAMAAIILGIIATAGLIYFDKGSKPETLADIDLVSTEELENYVTNQPLLVPEAAVNINTSEVAAEDVREFLDDFSDAALSQYMLQYTDSKLELN